MKTHEAFANHEIQVQNYKCFGESGGHIGTLAPVTVVIGRNNSGKTALIDAIRHIVTKGKSFVRTKHARGQTSPSFLIRSTISEQTLRGIFPENTSGGEIGGNHWRYGRRFVGDEIVVRYDASMRAVSVENFEFPDLRKEGRESYKAQLAERMPMPFDGLSLLSVAAERDVQPEAADANVTLASNGQGLTNMIRAFINRDNLPREEVEVELLQELNEVYRGDSAFTRISCREDEEGRWEIFLEEEGKGAVRLSQSGSSLKSVFIILVFLRLVPIVSKANLSKTVFVLEEPENNLHPSLLRRLLEFVASARARLQFQLLIATHSPIAIDWAAKRSDAKILHVTHDGVEAVVRGATTYLQHREILDDLDIRASDILQANGIIWVEGPSDRIYLRGWLDLISNGKLKEGVHYSVLFYGGKLLSHLTSLPPADQDRLVNTLSVNRNVAVIIDSDRHRGRAAEGKAKARKPRLQINETKQRIRDEVESVSGVCWITDGREVENYLPKRVLSVLAGTELSIDRYEKVPEHRLLSGFKGDKIRLANAAMDAFTREDIETDSELLGHLNQMTSRIQRWNAM